MRHISTLPDPPRRGPLARLGDYLDQKADQADKGAIEAGLTADAPSRWGRTYRDLRFDGLREMRAAGCQCVPVCRSIDDCTGGSAS